MIKIEFVMRAAFLCFVGAALQPNWAQPPAGRQGVPLAPGQNVNGMRIYIWAGLKSHSVGQHDYPQFLADWSKLLTERGAVVNGALHPAGNADLENTDVVVIYKAPWSRF